MTNTPRSTPDPASQPARPEDRTPREAARRFLHTIGIVDLLVDALAAHEALRVVGEDQIKLSGGAQARFNAALEAAFGTAPGELDTFARAQVLEGALRDFTARLRERGLLNAPASDDPARTTEP